MFKELSVAENCLRPGSAPWINHPYDIIQLKTVCQNNSSIE